MKRTNMAPAPGGDPRKEATIDSHRTPLVLAGSELDLAAGFGCIEDRDDEPVDAVVAGDGVLDCPYPDAASDVVDVALVDELGPVGAVQ